MRPRLRQSRRRYTPTTHNEAVRQHKPDYLLVAIALFLVATGLIVVYAISPGIAIVREVSESYYISKQVIAAVLGVVAFLLVSRLPVSVWKKLEVPLIAFSLLLAVAVQLFGQEVNGAQRWIQIGGISFQAAEFIKLTIVIWVAGFLNRQRNNGQLGSSETLKKLGVVVVLVGIIVAGFESDLGSAAVMVAIICCMSFIGGVPMKRLGIIILLIGMLGTLFIMSSGYRRERVATFLNPERDCQAAGYQICESLKAIGSGGMFGKGLGKSVQAYGYLPEAANDSIFAVLAEKFGFVGITILLGAFVVLFRRIARVMERTSDYYSRLLVAGVLTWFSIQAIINIGAMIGLLPLKGITLPFISTGGTSLLLVSAALGIVFQISRSTSYAVIDDEEQHKNTPSSPTVMRRRI
jgi:cell division protein FtsW